MSIVKNLPTSMVYLRQLIQLQLTNGGGSRQLVIKMTLSQEWSGRSESIYTAEYLAIRVQSGAQFLHLGQIEPTTKSFGGSNIAQALRTTGRLDYGNYSLCVIIRDEEAGVLEDCMLFQVMALTPPILIQPSDQSEILTTFPLLTWLPPTPTVPGIKYSLRLTSMDAKQSAIDALNRNQIIYSADNLLQNIHVYPATAPPLDTSKKYAWQVEAFKDGISLGITEVWEFSFKKLKAEKNIIATSYYRAKKVQDGSYCVAKPILELMVPDVKSEQQTSFKISETDGTPIKLFKKSEAKLKLKAGDNFHTIDLSKIALLENGRFYHMKISADQTVYNISFQYFQN